MKAESSSSCPTSRSLISTPPDKDFSNPTFNYLRLAFLSVFSAFSAYSPFASVLYESKGFTPTENGLLLAFSPLCTLIVIPPVMYLAETKALQMQIMYGSALASAALLTIVLLSDDKLVVVVASISYFVVNSPLLPIFDEHTMSVLGDENRRYYGGFRVMGAYSWLVGSFLSSLVFGRFGWHSLSIPVVVGYLVFMFSVYKTPVAKPVGEHHYFDVWAHILKHPEIINFMVGIATVGFGYSIIGTFLNLFLVSDELRAPPVLLGLTTVMTVSIEIPLFHNAEWLHKNFSDEQLFMGSVFGYIFRVWGYSVLPNCWLVLLLEPLHGLTFGLMWLASMSYFKKSFPKALANSAVGFVHSSAFGLGPVIGNVVGGILYENFGPRNLFRISGTILAVEGCIFWIVQDFFKKQVVCENDEVQGEKIESDAVTAIVADADAASLKE